MKIFMAIPYDSEISTFSKDFKVPSDIEGHEVFVRIMDTKDLKPPKEIDKICMARDLLAKEFMESDYDKMAFIDSDIICEGKDLIHLIENDDDVSVNTVFLRIKVPKWTIPLIKIRVLYGHTACMVVDRKAFEKLKTPYFRYKNHECHWSKGQYEDFQFFRNCKDAGIEVFKYPHVVGHQDRKTGEIYREYREVYP